LKTGDFVEARRRLDNKSLATVEKLTTLSEAAHFVKDGDHIAVGGCMFTRTPLALLMEILRQGRQNLTLSKALMCYEGEWFMAAGAVDSIITSWLGIGLPWGISRIMRENAEGDESKVRFEDWSHMGLGLRYKAGAMGLPYLPTLTMLGSDLVNVTEAKPSICPFTGEQLLLVPALFPDVAVIHVHRADRFGNCQIDGYPFMDSDIALASTAVLVTAEEIVNEDIIRSNPNQTVIPGFMVDALVEAPWGSFPHECHGLYEADFSFFDEYVDGIKTRGTTAINEYLEKYVYGVKNHKEYINLFEETHLLEQKRKAQELI
jgi:glutaconate CoA-transferase, subunit A